MSGLNSSSSLGQCCRSRRVQFRIPPACPFLLNTRKLMMSGPPAELEYRESVSVIGKHGRGIRSFDVDKRPLRERRVNPRCQPPASRVTGDRSVAEIERTMAVYFVFVIPVGDQVALLQGVGDYCRERLLRLEDVR